MVPQFYVAIMGLGFAVFFAMTTLASRLRRALSDIRKTTLKGHESIETLNVHGLIAIHEVLHVLSRDEERLKKGTLRGFYLSAILMILGAISLIVDSFEQVRPLLGYYCEFTVNVVNWLI